MRFLTYNIRHAEGYDGWISVARVANVIRQQRPDVVGMNEVWRVGTFHDQTKRVAASLGFSAAFQNNSKYPVLQQGNAVLARGAILAEHDLQLPRGIERRGALVCDLDIDGVQLTFASTHLSLGRATRSRQIAELVRELPRDRPLVIAGDFNCTAEELAPLRAFLTVESAPPQSYPAIRPSKSLDHIAYSAHWRGSRIHSVRSLASDHLAVWADLELV